MSLALRLPSPTCAEPTESRARLPALTPPAAIAAEPTAPGESLPGVIAPLAIVASVTLPAGVDCSLRRDALVRSLIPTEWFLIALPVTLPRLSSLPLMRCAACAGPPSATNRATSATIMAADGRRGTSRLIGAQCRASPDRIPPAQRTYETESGPLSRATIAA